MRKEDMIVGVDMDGVLVNLVEPWIEAYTKKTGEKLPSDIIEKDRIEDHVEQPKLLRDIMYADNFFFTLPPYPDAIEGFNELLNSGYQVHIVTSPCANSIYTGKDKKRWILKYFPKFNMRDITMTHHKGMYDCNILLDDLKHNLEPFSKRSQEHRAICMDQPWNQNTWKGERAKDWDDFLKKIDVVEKGFRVIF